MKKLLFISPELPFPPQSGGKVKSMKLLEALAERYRVTFASPLKQEDGSHLRAFHEVSPCDSHLHVPVDIPRSAVNLAASYLQGWPLNVRRTLDRGLQQRIADVAADHDIIVLDHYEVFPYLPADYDGLVVYHAHNAYFKMWERYASLAGNPAMRLAAHLEASRVKRYEAAVGNRAELVFAAPNDGRELVAAGVDGGKIHDTYHLGDDSQLALPELRYEDTVKKLMYVGFLGWEPNVQGLLWFIEEVWPRLQGQHPDLVFDIVGKNPDKRLQAAVEPHPAIRLTGYVADLQTIYSDSRVSVAPLLFGSGMKVKVLDAMARGIPTVTTSVGAEGIAVENGRHLLVEDDPARMAQRIDDLLGDPALWQRVQSASRDLIREQYTWRRLFRDMHRALDQGLKDHARGNPAAGAAEGEIASAA
jgi:glycosyltransferase involved in cell wall biosynthesis